MKAISELDAVDFTKYDHNDNVIYENHFKRRKIFGIVIFQKRYRAMTNKDKMNHTGFKK